MSTPVTKAITVHQPYAWLIGAHFKSAETRSNPLNGFPRPAGVRPLPGLAVEPGEHIAIHAAASTHTVREIAKLDWFGDFRVERNTCPEFDHDWAIWWRAIRRPYGSYPLPFGAVTCTASISEVLPICEATCREHTEHITVDRDWHIGLGQTGLPPIWRLTQYSGESAVDISAQRPYGHWTPGNWAYMLDDVASIDEPIPCKGAQGVWRLPDAITEALP